MGPGIPILLMLNPGVILTTFAVYFHEKVQREVLVHFQGEKQINKFLKSFPNLQDPE